MYEVPHELSDDLENEEIPVNLRTECTQSLVPNLSCINRNLDIALINWMKSAIKLSMKDRIHFSNSFVSLKVFYERL